MTRTTTNVTLNSFRVARSSTSFGCCLEGTKTPDIQRNETSIPVRQEVPNTWLPVLCVIFFLIGNQVHVKQRLISYSTSVIESVRFVILLNYHCESRKVSFHRHRRPGPGMGGLSRDSKEVAFFYGQTGLC